ncbi:hypothetical protein DSECCO2_610000 [anaerobic digester metagenome]
MRRPRPAPDGRLPLLQGAIMNRAALRLIAVFLLIVGLANPASAQTTKTAWEKQIGTDCNNGGASADFDTLAQCSATSGSGTFQKAPLFVGQVTSPPYATTACDAAKAGMLQYTGGVVQYCNGSAWSTLGSGGSSGTSSMNIVTASRSFSTIYQNTTGSSLFVTTDAVNTTAMGQTIYANVAATSSGLPSSSAATSTVNMVSFPSAGYHANMGFMVPPGYYYNVTTDGGAISIQRWTEWTFSLAGLSSYLGSAATTTNPSRADDITTGLFSATASTVSLATGGAERLRVTATGSVGIGTTSPNQLLEVFSSISDKGRIRISGTGTTADRYDGLEIFGKAGSATSFAGGLFREESTDRIAIWNSTGSILNISQSGNVGIVTTTPSERLDLGGGNIKMGFERVTNACGALANDNTPCVATCPSGKYAISGGCNMSGAGIRISQHLGNTSWTCYSTAAAAGADATVTCANMK